MTRTFRGFLAPDAAFRFGSAPPVQSHAAIREAGDDFFSTIAGCRYPLHRPWQVDDTLVREGNVTDRHLDGSEITLLSDHIFSFQGELVLRYSIYADVAPLFAPG